jgi:hypothetical protein
VCFVMENELNTTLRHFGQILVVIQIYMTKLRSHDDEDDGNEG